MIIATAMPTRTVGKRGASSKSKITSNAPASDVRPQT